MGQTGGATRGPVRRRFGGVTAASNGGLSSQLHSSASFYEEMRVHTPPAPAGLTLPADHSPAPPSDTICGLRYTNQVCSALLESIESVYKAVGFLDRRLSGTNAEGGFVGTRQRTTRFA